MIKVGGSTRRDFIFPTTVEHAIAFYDDLDRIVSCLSHITMVEKFAPNEMRVMYNTKELGLIRFIFTVIYKRPLITKKKSSMSMPPTTIPPLLRTAVSIVVEVMAFSAAPHVSCPLAVIRG